MYLVSPLEDEVDEVDEPEPVAAATAAALVGEATATDVDEVVAGPVAAAAAADDEGMVEVSSPA